MRHAIKRGFLTAAFGGATVAMGAVAAQLALGSVVGLGAAVAFGAALFGFLDSAWNLLPARLPKSAAQPLSAGEAALLKSVFGAALADADIAKIRKVVAPKDPRMGAETLNRRAVGFYGAAHAEEDYSRAVVPQNFGVFMHEMTRLWQRTSLSASFMRKVRWTRSYDYKLTERSRFGFFGAEQQASIIEDYALRFLYPHGDIPAAHIATTAKNDALLQRVVERKFPAARQARLALAEKKRAQAAPEEREKFLRGLGGKITATFGRWAREPGSGFRFHADIVKTADKKDTCLAVFSSLPDTLLVRRDGAVFLHEDPGYDAPEVTYAGTSADAGLVLSSLRLDAEERGLLGKIPARAIKEKSCAMP